LSLFRACADLIPASVCVAHSHRKFKERNDFMESMSAQEIIHATGAETLSTSAELDLARLKIEGVSTDSRSIANGDIFFALRGERFDGHDFVNHALSKGGVAAVVSREWIREQNQSKRFSAPLLVVADPVRALQDLAGHYRRKFSVTVIGITGTNGKTTTKDMVAAVLSAGFRTMKTEGNFNNHIGVPLTLFELSSGDQMAVVEMGMSGPGEIRRSAKISLPQYGLVTNIGPAHLEQLKSLENITRAKFELLEMLPADGVVFLNADDKRLMAQKVVPPSRVITFGMAPEANYRAIRVGSPNGQRTNFWVDNLGQFQIPTLGRHNVYNALGAIAVGREVGLSVSLIRAALEDFSPSPMRMKRLVIEGVVILNDAYNANPASTRAAIEVLSDLKAEGRKIAVLGDMLELGPQGPRLHRQLGHLVAKSGIDMLVVVGEMAKRIAQGAIQEGFEPQRVVRCADANQAAEYLKNRLQPRDVILLKASRAVSLEEILPLLWSSFQKG
jgi:UDP-N-acetylmuramoyl-tripeptide--D-alanyl-D-alanine ligase